MFLAKGVGYSPEAPPVFVGHYWQEVLDQEFHPDGYNVGSNAGEAAGQTVMHLHVHVIPRYQDDVEDPRRGVRLVIPSKAKYWDT